MSCVNLNCFQQLTDRDQLQEVYKQLCTLTCEKSNFATTVAFGSPVTLPEGTVAWSIFFQGATPDAGIVNDGEGLGSEFSVPNNVTVSGVGGGWIFRSDAADVEGHLAYTFC